MEADPVVEEALVEEEAAVEADPVVEEAAVEEAAVEAEEQQSQIFTESPPQGITDMPGRERGQGLNRRGRGGSYR